MIRIDAIRELRRDLHMRPFEADRRVYLILSAHLLNEDAADALLKDLEEPPSYAVIVLVADDLGPIPETIRSRCQLVPFRRLSERAVREVVDARAPELDEERRTALARVAGGRLDRVERLLDPKAVSRRVTLLEQARAVYREPAFEPAAAAAALLACARERGSEAKAVEEANVAGLELTARESRAARPPRPARRRARGAARPARGARRLVPRPRRRRGRRRAGGGARRPARRAARRRDPRAAGRRRARAAEAVRETWRKLEEFNLAPQLALEALFVEIARELQT